VAVDDDAGNRELDDVRARLDSLDRQLVHILARRFEVGHEAAQLKRSLGIPVHDPEREERVVSQACEWARSEGLPEAEVADLFRKLIAISRTAQLTSNQ
jgi:chorismate mutase